MASLMVKLISEALLIRSTKRSEFSMVVRHLKVKERPKPKRGTVKHRNLIASRCESLNARGFLRSYKPYTPKETAREEILVLCNKILGSDFDQNLPLSREDKFVLLNECYLKLSHSVPNSLLHKIVTAADVIEFYETPVTTTVPFDEFKNQELPPNLHIQYDYVRFDPETDVKFKGISAFPRSSTIVTGLKYREKYQGFVAKSPYLSAEVTRSKVKN